jgi:hypothetical protein
MSWLDLQKIELSDNISWSSYEDLFDRVEATQQWPEATKINTIQIIKNNQNFLKLNQDIGVKLINNLTKSLSKVVSNKEWLARNNKKITWIDILIPSEFLAYVFQESGWNPSATWKSWERGLFQIKPPLAPKDAQQQFSQDRKAYAESYETFEWLKNIWVVTHSLEKLDDIDCTLIWLTRFLESKRSQLFSLDKLNQTQIIEKQPIQITHIEPKAIERLLPLVHNRWSIVQWIIRNIYQTTWKLPVTLRWIKKWRYWTSEFDKVTSTTSSQFDNLTIALPTKASQTDLILDIKKPTTQKDIIIFEKLFSITYETRFKTHPESKYTIQAKNRIITTKYIEQVNWLRKQFEL